MALPNFNTLHKFALHSKTSASNVLVSFSAYFASSIYISCHSSLWIIFPLISKNLPYQNNPKYVLNLIHLFILHFFIFIFSESTLIHLIFLYLTLVFFFFSIFVFLYLALVTFVNVFIIYKNSVGVCPEEYIAWKTLNTIKFHFYFSFPKKSKAQVLICT